MNNDKAKKVAEYLRQQGRDGDTMLAHINPQEAQMLKAMGGSGTINPKTGLPEYKTLGWVGDLFRDPGEALGELDDKVNEEYPGGWEGVAATVAAIMGMNGGFDSFGGSSGGFEWLPNGEMTVASEGSTSPSSFSSFLNNDVVKNIKTGKDYYDLAKNVSSLTDSVNIENNNQNEYSQNYLNDYLQKTQQNYPTNTFKFENEEDREINNLIKMLRSKYGY
jgi:hypothetical protein